MANIYTLTTEYEQLFASFDRFNNIEDELTCEDGNYYHNGCLVEDIEEYKNDLISAWFDTLEGMEGELEEKLLNLACYIKELDAQAADIKAAKDKLAKRQKTAENKSRRLREYVLEAMQTINRKKIESPQAVISLSAGRESVQIADEKEFIKWAKENGDDLLNFKEPDISKKAISLAIKSGREIPFASIEKAPSISIK